MASFHKLIPVTRNVTDHSPQTVELSKNILGEYVNASELNLMYYSTALSPRKAASSRLNIPSKLSSWVQPRSEYVTLQ